MLIKYTFVLILWFELEKLAGSVSPLQNFECRYTPDVPESTEVDSSPEYDCYTLEGPHQAACSDDTPIQVFKEEFSNELVTDYLLGCCEENADDEKKIKLLDWATGCRSTPCQKNLPNPCSKLNARYVNGSRLHYEAVVHETCSFHGEEGLVSVCCPENSMEKVMRSLMGAEPQEFPHQVFVDNGNHDCGGTIYNDQYIITAAHCLVDDNGTPIAPKDITVMAGSNICGMYKQANEYSYKVTKTFIHPEFSQRYCESVEHRFQLLPNDIALILLTRKLEFSDRIRPLKVAPKDFDPSLYSTQVLTVGWGKPDGYKLPVSLLKSNMKLRPKSACSKLPNSDGSKIEMYSGKDKDSISCAGGFLNETDYLSIERRCGDSGGPVICIDSDGTAVLCGVMSSSPNAIYCNKENDLERCIPGDHIDVNYYIDWIEEIAGKQNPDDLAQNYPYGRSVPWNQYLHQVLIRSQGSDNCAGTLIQPDVVITAAHCVFDLESKPKKLKANLEVVTERETLKVLAARTRATLIQTDLKSRVGAGSSSEGGARFNKDIAVVLLQTKATNAPKFPKGSRISLRGRSQVIEWAFPKLAMEKVHLVQRNFSILSKAECKSRLDSLRKSNIDVPLGIDEYCGFEKYSGGSMCDRTLGGGVFCQDERKEFLLCGVQIHRACEFSVPGIFLDLSKYTRWIQSMMRNMKEGGH